MCVCACVCVIVIVLPFVGSAVAFRLFVVTLRRCCVWLLVLFCLLLAFSLELVLSLLFCSYILLFLHFRMLNAVIVWTTPGHFHAR